MSPSTQESDKDIALALEHVSVLQRQLTYVQLQNNQPSLAAPSATHDTFEGIPLEGARKLPDTDLQQGGGAPEIPFLRRRVEHLTVENRQLRRQCAQLKLTAVSGGAVPADQQRGTQEGATSNRSDPPSGEGQSSSQLVMAQVQTGMIPLFDGSRPPSLTSPGALQPDRHPSSGLDHQSAAQTSEREEALRRELSERAAELAQLQRENSRLMEMSSALRSERDRLLSQQRATPQAEGLAAVPRGRADGGKSGVEAMGSPVPLPNGGLMAEAVSPSRPPAGLASYQPLAASTSDPDASKIQVVARNASSSNPYQEHSVYSSRSPSRHPERSQSQQGSELPSSAIFAQEEVELERALLQGGRQRHGVLSMSAASGLFTDSSLNKRSRNASLDGSTFAVGTMVPLHDRAAAMAEVAVVRAQHWSRSPTEGRSGGVGGLEEIGEGLQASGLSPGSRPPSGIPGSASSRETASQRARLQALQRRREEEATRPRARNYNQRD